MTKLVLALLMTGNLSAQTLEEQYVLHAEGVVNNAYGHITFVVENIQIMVGMLVENDEISQYAHNVFMSMLTYIMRHMMQYQDSVYNADVQMGRLKAEYQRREE